MIVFSTGYLGDGRVPPRASKTVAFREMVHRLDLVVLDIRTRPWSMAPCWRAAALRELVGADRYRHVPELGNRNYNNGGPIDIADPAAGIAVVLATPAPRRPLLLCGCEDHRRCHRLTVAGLLAPYTVAAGGGPIEDVIEIHRWGTPKGGGDLCR